MSLSAAKTPATSSMSGAEGVERFLGTELAGQVQFLTARARAKGSAHGNQVLAELGLKVRQYSALSLAASGLKPTQRELGEFLDLDPSQVVALIDFLERRGAVRRDIDPRDRRSRTIMATDEGLELHEQATRALRKSEDITLANLTRGEREQLRALLVKIAF